MFILPLLTHSWSSTYLMLSSNLHDVRTHPELRELLCRASNVTEVLFPWVSSLEKVSISIRRGLLHNKNSEAWKGGNYVNGCRIEVAGYHVCRRELRTICRRPHGRLSLINSRCGTGSWPSSCPRPYEVANLASWTETSEFAVSIAPGLQHLGANKVPDTYSYNAHDGTWTKIEVNL